MRYAAVFLTLVAVSCLATNPQLDRIDKIVEESLNDRDLRDLKIDQDGSRRLYEANAAESGLGKRSHPGYHDIGTDDDEENSKENKNGWYIILNVPMANTSLKKIRNIEKSMLTWIEISHRKKIYIISFQQDSKPQI